MLVQKKSKKKQFLLLVISIVILGIAAYLFTLNPKKPSDLSYPGENSTETTTSSVPVFGLDASIFGKEQMTQLKDRSGESHTAQYSETATDKEAVLPPEKISVYNPQVGNKLVVYWENPDKKNTIRIYRSQSLDELGTVIADGIEGETNYQDTSVENNTRYYYTVKAVNSAGRESENTNQVTGAPTDIFPPESPTAVAIKNLGTGNEIEITWVNPTDSDFDYVRIYRSQKEGAIGTLILDEKVTEPIFVDDNVKEGVTYYYTLTAVDKYGNESEKSLLPVGGNKKPFEPFETSS